MGKKRRRNVVENPTASNLLAFAASMRAASSAPPAEPLVAPAAPASRLLSLPDAALTPNQRKRVRDVRRKQRNYQHARQRRLRRAIGASASATEQLARVVPHAKQRTARHSPLAVALGALAVHSDDCAIRVKRAEGPLWTFIVKMRENEKAQCAWRCAVELGNVRICRYADGACDVLGAILRVEESVQGVETADGGVWQAQDVMGEVRVRVGEGGVTAARMLVNGYGEVKKKRKRRKGNRVGDEEEEEEYSVEGEGEGEDDDDGEERGAPIVVSEVPSRAPVLATSPDVFAVALRVVAELDARHAPAEPTRDSDPRAFDLSTRIHLFLQKRQQNKA